MPGPVGDALREAEVRQVAVLAPLTGVDQDVRRLHVPVDEAAGVRRIERRGDLARDRDRRSRDERPFGEEQPPQVGPVHVAHRDVQRAVDLAGVVDRHDIRVIEPRGETRTRAAAARGSARPPRGRGARTFSATGRSSLPVERPVHLAHPAAADELAELIPGERATRARVGRVGHRASLIQFATRCTSREAAIASRHRAGSSRVELDLPPVRGAAEELDD